LFGHHQCSAQNRCSPDERQQLARHTQLRTAIGTSRNVTQIAGMTNFIVRTSMRLRKSFTASTTRPE
jgi:hypothetical protein